MPLDKMCMDDRNSTKDVEKRQKQRTIQQEEEEEEVDEFNDLIYHLQF